MKTLNLLKLMRFLCHSIVDNYVDKLLTTVNRHLIRVIYPQKNVSYQHVVHKKSGVINKLSTTKKVFVFLLRLLCLVFVISLLA